MTLRALWAALVAGFALSAMAQPAAQKNAPASAGAFGAGAAGCAIALSATLATSAAHTARGAMRINRAAAAAP